MLEKEIKTELSERREDIMMAYRFISRRKQQSIGYVVCGDYIYFVTGQPLKLYYSTNPDRVPSLHMRHTVSQSPSTGTMERDEQTMQKSEKKTQWTSERFLLHIFQH
ncbi:uncharacterized protein LOC144441430 [Glandiceps talaboti]